MIKYGKEFIKKIKNFMLDLDYIIYKIYKIFKSLLKFFVFDLFYVICNLIVLL